MKIEQNHIGAGARGVDVDQRAGGEVSWGKVPAVDFVEHDKAYTVTAELPGMSESDIDVKYADGTLTIRGEKKEDKEEKKKDKEEKKKDKEEKKKDYYLSERRFGSFQRVFQVPSGVDADKIDATFKNGVLAVTLPKSVEAVRNEKKIAIKKA
jgi:HSP20 family protein